MFTILKVWGWRDGSGVKVTRCFYRGLGFHTQGLYDALQLLEDPMPLSPPAEQDAQRKEGQGEEGGPGPRRGQETRGQKGGQSFV